MWSLIRNRDRSLGWNTIANLAGRLVPAILAIFAVPVLLHTIGTEAYGIIGLYASIQVVFAFLDFGLSAATAREVAQDVALNEHARRSSALLRTLEAIYWPTGMVLGVVLAGSARWIATRWLNVDALPHSEVELSLIMMALAVAMRWPINLYMGVLQGMQLQVSQNAVTVGAALIRILGGLALVTWFSPTIAVFMVWQAVASFGEVIAMAVITWRALGEKWRTARFDLRILKTLWRFALSFNAVSILAIVVSQADKFVISRRMPLEALGFYSIAVTATGAVPHVATALSAAVFPRFTAYTALGRDDELRSTYADTTRLLVYAVVPATFSLAFFAGEILQLWTGSAAVVAETSAVLVLLATAFTCNALYFVPYTLAMAAGHTEIPLTVNLFGAPAIVIACYLLVPRFGIEGAALAFLALMAVNLAAYLLWIHRRLLGGGLRTYFLVPVLPFVALGLSVFGLARVAASYWETDIASLFAWSIALVVYVLVGMRWLPGNAAKTIISFRDRIVRGHHQNRRKSRL